MTAQIDNFEGFGLLDYELMELLDTEADIIGFNADAYTISVEGNVLGAGELWQRLGSTQGPVVSTESIAIGYRFHANGGMTLVPSQDEYGIWASVVSWEEN